MNSLLHIKNHPLFANIQEKEILQLMTCFHFKEHHFSKDEYLLMEGNCVHSIGIIINGIVIMEKSDFYGNNYFVIELHEHAIFGEIFMNHIPLNSTLNYKAISDCTIIFFSYADIWSNCQQNCGYHKIFIENLMYLLALKSRTMLAKIEILSKKSLRERILTFFTLIQDQKDVIHMNDYQYTSNMLKENQIAISLNKTELAEYLGVNRSALVRELGRMKKDGIIDYDKNIFTILPSR